MTRVVNGIYDDIELQTGFFIEDKRIDIIVGWLDSYANALEKQWIKNGSEGDPKIQKFAQVRSFKAAVERGRNTGSVIG